MGCDHEKRIIMRYKPKTVESPILDLTTGKVNPRRGTIYVPDPYVECTKCSKTRGLSQREKDELYEAIGWK